MLFLRPHKGTFLTRSLPDLHSKKYIFIYTDNDLNFGGLVQPLDKIVVRSSHDLSLFVGHHFEQLATW